MKRLKNIMKSTFLACLASAGLSVAWADTPPFFPTGIVVNEKGEMLMSDKGVKRIDVFAPDGKSILRSFPMQDAPTGIVLDGEKAYVTTFGDNGGMLHFMSAASGEVAASIPTGSGACHPLLSMDKKFVYVCNQFQGTVSEIDIANKKVTRTVAVLREPKSAVLSKDGKFLFVTNFLPQQRADLDYVACCVSVIEMDGFTKVKDIRLANGSNALRGICITPDGKYIYVSHNLGRYTVPTSQLQQGWMNTSAFSVIDVEKQEFLGAVLVDEPERGAAGIWSIACNEENIYISHSGTHDVSVIQHKPMLEKFINYPKKELLDYDLTFLYGLRERIQLKGNGPREMALVGDKLYVPTYFADVLNVMDTNTNEIVSVALNPDRKESDANKGERYFNDASNCFQNWQSCNGCHPGDARTDGMNWDLMNDGVGNSKNCKSLLISHLTPPAMISGVRDHAFTAVRTGFKFIQFFEISEEDAKCVDAYVTSLKPVPSPYLVNGELSEKAKAGKKIFEKMKCGDCHSGVYYTDMKMHRIGEDV